VAYKTFTSESQDNGFTLQPCSVIGPGTPGNIAYFTEAPLALVTPVTTLRIWALSDPLSSSSTLQSTWVYNVPGYRGTAAAPQPTLPDGRSIYLEPGNGFGAQGNAFWRNGSLWFCHTAGDSSLRASVAYYRVALNGYPAGTPSLGEAGWFDGGQNVFRYQPAIGGNSDGETVIVFTESSGTAFPAIRYAARGASDTSFQGVMTLKQSLVSYDNGQPSGSVARWGDYASVAADPLDNSFWITHEWVRSSQISNWGTWWGRVKPIGSNKPLAEWLRRYQYYGYSLADEMANAMALVSTQSGTALYVAGVSDDGFTTVKYSLDGEQRGGDWLTLPGHDAASAKAIAGSYSAVYVTGSSGISDPDFCTVKYDPQSSFLTRLWTRRYPDAPGTVDHAHGIGMDSSGNAYVVGTSDGNIAVVKYDLNGNRLWATQTSGWVTNKNCIHVRSSGQTYVLGGLEAGDYSLDLKLMRLNAAGGIDWITTYSGSGSDAVLPRALAVDANGNAYVAACYDSINRNGTSGDFLILKFSANGVNLWAASHGTTPWPDLPYAIAVDGGGSVLVTGYSEASGPTVTIKYNSSGAQQWLQSYSSADAWYPLGGTAINVDSSANIYIVAKDETPGSLAPKYVLIKYNSAGAIQWSTRQLGRGGLTTAVHDMKLDGGGSVFLVGAEDDIVQATASDFVTIKYKQP
jgi:hypothetical protein